MKRIIVLVTVVAVVAATVAFSALSVGAQTTGQTPPGQTTLCAPWSKEWDISGGWWYFSWYRWCHDPSIEGAWYRDWGNWEWSDPVNLCPESGDCRVSVG